MAAILAAAGSSAQAQGVERRKAAACGPSENDEKPVWETHIAAGLNRVMAVYQVGHRGDPDHEIGYAIAAQLQYHPLGEPPVPIPTPWTWVEEGFVGDPNDPNAIDVPFDPTVAYDGVTGRFVVAGQGKGAQHCPDRSAPILARHDAELGWLDGGWNWMVLDGDPNNPAPCCDKPWLVAGEVIPPTNGHEHQEFYICYTGTGILMNCLRSRDGGDTWRGGEIRIDDDPLIGKFPAPAPAEDGSLYLAFETAGAYQFIRGQDPDPNTPDDAMTWDYLYDADEPDEPLEVELKALNLGPYLPHVTSHAGVDMFAQLAADPTNEDVLYVVYHDKNPLPTDPLNDTNTDVFLTRLERQGDGTWKADHTVPVNDPDPTEPPPATPSDQFLPAVTVDPYGRIHVIFYDDRNFPEQVDWSGDPNDPNYWYPRFDVYYAYSENAGEDFTNLRLFSTYEGDPNDPAVNFLHDVHDYFEITDYIGITYRHSANDVDVFTSFTGSHVTQDAEDDESLIWSSRIAWTQLP